MEESEDDWPGPQGRGGQDATPPLSGDGEGGSKKNPSGLQASPAAAPTVQATPLLAFRLSDFMLGY